MRVSSYKYIIVKRITLYTRAEPVDYVVSSDLSSSLVDTRRHVLRHFRCTRRHYYYAYNIIACYVVTLLYTRRDLRRRIFVYDVHVYIYIYILCVWTRNTRL